MKNHLRASSLCYMTAGLALLVYGAGLIIPIMEIDGATYANISMVMHDTGNYRDIIFKNADWLDKPHFQFWVTALFYKLLGVGTAGYKIPALLFSLLAVLYTYLFGKKFYSRLHGSLAALILVTAQHFILSSHDVRAEPYLTGLTIFSLYYFASWLKDKSWIYLLAGSAGLGALMMTKGLYTIIPVASAIGFALLYKKEWKEVFHWQWILAGLVTLLFTLPTIYSYYLQFDLHPEKVIFGKTGVSGVRFFFWDSQWGRFTNTGPIKGAGDPSFFLHTLLWAFAPWAFLAYFALYDKTKMLLKRSDTYENYTFFGFIVLFLIFSASRFQLPHYLVPIFPLLAIVTAHTLIKYGRNLRFLKTFNVIHLVSVVLMFLLIPLLQIVFFDHAPTIDTWVVLIITLGVIVRIYAFQNNRLKKVIFPAALAVLAVNYYLNRNFYPELLLYQSESEAAFYIKSNRIPADEVVTFDKYQIVMDVYLHRLVPEVPLDDRDLSGLENKYVFTSEKGLEKLREEHIHFELLKAFDDFRITTLNYTFLNKRTRAQAVDKFYLVKTGTIPPSPGIP